MDQMVVYRVECPNSRSGMYRVSSMALSKMCDRNQHPGPQNDNRLMLEISEKGMESDESWHLIDQKCRFGFASKKQMRKWISDDEWKSKLAAEGLMVAKYQVPKSSVAIGKTQAIYRPENATLLEHMCPTKI